MVGRRRLMSNEKRAFYRIGIAIVWLMLICITGRTETAAQESGEIPDGWRLMPRLGLSLEYGGFIVHQDNYTSKLRRKLEIDVLQYRRHIFYLDFEENTSFGTPFDKWDFSLLKYNVVLGGYRYDFGEFYLGIFANHQCNSPFLTEKFNTRIDRDRANLYCAGLEFMTKNMRLGMKDRGINFDSPKAFEFLGRWAGAASASRVLSKLYINLNWHVKGQVRYDIFRYRRLVPYLEVGGDLLIGPVTRLAPSVEMGARYHWHRVNITPFIKWARDQEALTLSFIPSKTPLIAKHSLYAGARVETLLDADSFRPSPGQGQMQLLPEIHGVAHYALHLQRRDFNARGEIELDFELLRLAPWTVFFYTNMNFDARKQDLKPDKVNYSLQYGLTYAWSRYFLEGFVQNQQRLDTNIFRGTQERANLAGVRVGTSGMKPGHYNDGISFEGAKFQWLNKWNAQASLAHYFYNRDWQYLWNLAAQVRWDLLRWHRVVPYVQGEVNWRSGGGRTDNALEYYVEPGLRFHGILDLALYYRFNHREDVLFFRGPGENLSLVGIKALF